MLKYGIIVLAIAMALDFTLGQFFEIRNRTLYQVVDYSTTLLYFILITLILLGLYKLKFWWKWLFVIPIFSLFLIGGTMAVLFRKIGNEIDVKEDTKVLYVHKTDPRRKIIEQVYWTGFTADKRHNDTILVREINSYFRLSRKVDSKEMVKELNH
jgi:hypothetical protein